MNEKAIGSKAVESHSLSALRSRRAKHSDLAYMEFCGATLTDPLVKMNISGGLLFILALIVTFIYPWVAAIGALAASLLCLPLYLYLTAPGLAQWMFPGANSARA
jgi:hypothetical protein